MDHQTSVETAALHRELERHYAARDAHGLVLALAPKAEKWARGRILTRKIRFSEHLLNDLVQEGMTELLEAVPRMFDRQMASGLHIVRSARKTAVAKFIQVFDERSVVHAPHSTLKDRRRRRREGALRVRDSAKRLPDMPECIADHMPQCLFEPGEFYRQVSGAGGKTKKQDSGRFEFDTADESFDPGDSGRRLRTSSGYSDPYDGPDEAAEEYLQLAREVGDKALELSTGLTHRAIELMLDGTWNEAKERWDCPDVTTVAKKLQINRRTLADHLNALAVPIAEAVSSDIAELGGKYLGSKWPKSADSDDLAAKNEKLPKGTNRGTVVVTQSPIPLTRAA